MNLQQSQYGASNNSDKPLAPPSYPSGSYGYPTTNNGPAVTDQKSHHGPQPTAMPQGTQVAPPIYHASPNAPPGGRRILHIYHQGWTRRHTQVMDSDKVTPIYTVETKLGGIFSSKPHMTIVNAATGQLSGTASFRAFSGGIDIEIHNRPVTFDKPAIFTSAREFQSSATGGILTWRRDGVFSGGDLKCIDQTEQIVATFESNNWALSKDGKFEIAPNVNGLLFDEVLITGLAAMEYQRRQRQSSSGGGGGG